MIILSFCSGGILANAAVAVAESDPADATVVDNGAKSMSSVAGVGKLAFVSVAACVADVFCDEMPAAALLEDAAFGAGAFSEHPSPMVSSKANAYRPLNFIVVPGEIERNLFAVEDKPISVDRSEDSLFQVAE